MRVTVLSGGFIGFLAALAYTLCVMERHEEFGQTYWAVAASFKPGVGYRPVLLVLAVTAVLPILLGGLLGDCVWNRRILAFAVAGTVSLGLVAWFFCADLPAKHGHAGENTRGALVVDAAFAGALAGAKLAERLGGRKQE